MKVLKSGGKDYIVHYSINSLVRMEQDTGKSFTQMFGEEEIGVTVLRDVIYYGLISKQYKFTKNEAGELMDELIGSGKSIMEISHMFLGELISALGMKVDKDKEVPNA